MFSVLCHSGTWGSLRNFGVWGWIALILNLIFWVGLIAGLTLLAVLGIRGGRDPPCSRSGCYRSVCHLTANS